MSGRRTGWRTTSILSVTFFLLPLCHENEDLTESETRVTINKTGAGTVISSPSGINCGQVCTGYFAPNQDVVELTATANQGAVFDTWGGDCSGSNATCTLTLDSHKTVTATFKASATGETPSTTGPSGPTPGEPTGESGPQQPTGSGIFRIVITGIWCEKETFDDILQGDGRGDEVYLSVGESILLSNGEPFIQGHESTSVRIGDLNETYDPDRQVVGGEVGETGWDTGDKFPWPKPWVYVPPWTQDRLPFLVARVNLTGGKAIVISPTIWEWDDRSEGWRDWVTWFKGIFDSVVPSLKPVINNTNPSVSPSPGGVATTDFILTAISAGLGGLASLPTGRAGDRPIGISGGENPWTFIPKVVVLNEESARWMTQNDLGKGYGVIQLDYKDEPETNQPGHFALFLHVTEMPVPAP
jgi:Divergent InlB B-repeat domain